MRSVFRSSSPYLVCLALHQQLHQHSLRKASLLDHVAHCLQEEDSTFRFAGMVVL